MPKAATDSIIDVVDARNRVTGRTRRAEVLDAGLNFRTVHIFVFTAEDRLVLQKLGAEHPRSSGRLGSSVAGYVMSGESYEQAAYRKLQMELGIDAPIESVGTFGMRDERSRKFVSLYVCHARFQEIRFNPYEMVGVVELDLSDVDAKVREAADMFTPTFVQAYGYFRRQRRGDPG